MSIRPYTAIRFIAAATVFLISLVNSSTAQERDRSKIPVQYTWDLTALYPTDQAWRSAKEKLVAELPKLKEYQGTLASSAQRLADALETESRMDKGTRATQYLRGTDIGPGHPCEHLPGDAAGSSSTRIHVPGGLCLH